MTAKGRRRVGVVCGGPSAEHAISLISAVNLVAAIDRTRFDVVVIGVDRGGGWHRHDPEAFATNADDPAQIALREPINRLLLNPGGDGALIDAESGTAIEPLDVFFPIIHGTAGEDGSLQGVLRWLGVPFVGSDVLGSAAAMDKDVAKRLLASAGLDTTPYRALTRMDALETRFESLIGELGSTLFVKPANQGSSVGITEVENADELEPALAAALAYDNKVLVESAVTGREIECAVLGNDELTVSGCGEIVLGDGFYSYETKYLDANAAGVSVPADIDSAVSERVREVAATAFRTLGCAGLARVDVFVTADERVIVNEINTLPGFTPISMYPKLFEHAGIGYSELLTRLIELALKRFNPAASRDAVYSG